MQFLSIIAALSLAAGTHAWANDGRGTWVANDNWYNIRGSIVHEACTVMNRNDVIYSNNESCAYWTDGAGGMKKGKCQKNKNEPVIKCR